MGNNKITYRYTDLELLILKCYGTYQNGADALGMSRMNLYNKLNNKVEWKKSDIVKCCELMHIPKEDVYDYFFA